MGRAGRPPLAAGFTLLELLVVVVIVGILASLVTLSISFRDPTALAQQEAERLAALMGLAGEEAVVNGESLGVGFTRGGYSFYRLDSGSWTALADDPLLRPRELPEGLELLLDEPRKGESPVQVLLLASGEQTPFALELEQSGKVLYRLRGDELGGLAMEAVP